VRLALNGKKRHRKHALKEARAVGTEHAVMLQCLDICTQELNLHTDLSNFRPQSSVASKAKFVTHLLRATRANWVDPDMTVENVAAAHYEDWVPSTFPKTIMDYYTSTTDATTAPGSPSRCRGAIIALRFSWMPTQISKTSARIR
jgi:hypothetical protein